MENDLVLTPLEHHKNIAEAMAAAQADFPDIPKTKTATVRGKTKGGEPYSYEYAYADFADVLKVVRPILSKHGLSINQPIRRKELKLHLTTVIRHVSGETIESDGLPIPEIMDPQQLGSLLTYWKRYDGCALLGIQPEADDDARHAMASSGRSKFEKQERKMENQAAQNRISDRDIRAFWAAVNASGKKPAEIKAWLKDQRLGSIEEMPADMADKAIKWAMNEGTRVPKDIVSVLQKSAEGAAREKAMKSLFGTAAKYHIPESDVKTCAYEKYQVNSMTSLSEAQIGEMEEWVKEVAAAVAES